jgi:hypothetical protein
MAGLGKGYEGLYGEALLDKLVEDRELRILEAMWRAGDQAICQQLVDRLLAVDEPVLTDLIAGEVLEPRFRQDLAQNICPAITLSPRRLPAPRIAQLIEKLRDNAVLQPGYQPYRATFEIWALNQHGKAVDEFALDVVDEGTPMSTIGDVRQAAFRRADEDPTLGKRMASRLCERLESKQRIEDWLIAADFVESTEGKVENSALIELVRELVLRAPELHRATSFRPVLQALGAKHAVAQLSQRLEGQTLGLDPGSEALIRLVESASGRDDQKRLFLAVLQIQTANRDVMISLANELSEDGWRVRFEALRTLPVGNPVPNLGPLLDQAPANRSADVIEIAAMFAATPNMALGPVAVRAAQKRIGTIAAGDWGEELVEVFFWPGSVESEPIALLKAVLDETLQQEMTRRAGIIAAAFVTDTVSAEVAAALVRDGTTADVLRAPCLTGTHLRALLPALYGSPPAETSAAVRQCQTERFSLDLCAGLAGLDPSAAFQGASVAYDGLDGGQRDELVGLLDAHATAEHLPLLEKFMESAPAARDRRVRALKVAGRLVTPRTTMPVYFSEALRQNHSPIRQAALDAIAEARPRDRELVVSLRDLAGSGPIAAAARRALDALVSDYIATLDELPTDPVRKETLALLGAAARPQAIDLLLDHLGLSQIHDGTDVHQAAAAALADLSHHQPFAPEQIDRLGALIDDDGAEVDPQARVGLEEAFANASIGDKAFVVLKDLLGFTFGDPDALFLPAQRAKLGRALSLYKNDRSRGEPGWPGVIQQLDIAAEQIVRAAYLVHGDSEPMKAMIRDEEHNKPDLGSLIQSLGGKLKNAKPYLELLHEARSTKTEYPHPGTKPTAEDVDQAERNFREGVKVLIGQLKQGDGAPRSRPS